MRKRMAVALCVLLVALPGAATALTPPNEPPLPDAGLDQTVRQGATVALDAGGSRDPDGELTGYDWRIEAPNGTTVAPACADCATTAFVADAVGTYTVTVTVTDDDGASREDTLYVTVEAPPEGPSVSLSGDTAPAVGEEAVYTASFAAGDAPVESVTWSLDGERFSRTDTAATEEADTLSRAFDSPGTRTLTVTVRDDNGRTATDTLDVSPTESSTPAPATGTTTPERSADVTTEAPSPAPSLTVDGPTTVLAGNAADYTATTNAVPPGATVRWDDGGSGTGVTRRWRTPGTYTVSASTSARGESASDTLTVEVIDPSLEIDGPTELYADVAGTFSVRTSGLPEGTTFSWGDGATSATVSREWTEPGNYTLEVTATVRGRVVADTHTVEVVRDEVATNDPPRVDIHDPGDISPGEAVTLSANYSDSDGYIVDVDWMPGRTVTVPNNSDYITVILNVTDDDGASAADRIQLRTIEGASRRRETDVRCFYTDPSQQERNNPSGGCRASWGESWTQDEVAFAWTSTVGEYDVTWVQIDSTWYNESETGAVADPAENCFACNGLTDAQPGSNPEATERTDPTSDATDPLDPYTKNGETVRSDLTGDGIINVIDWNRRFDNGVVNGSGSDDSAPRGGTGDTLRGANGETTDAVTGPVDDADRSTGTATSGPSGALQGGGESIGVPSPTAGAATGLTDSTPAVVTADSGGTNGRPDANTSNGSVERSTDQSTADYREEFTSRLSL